jgi:bla regulator protein BlaR1
VNLKTKRVARKFDFCSKLLLVAALAVALPVALGLAPAAQSRAQSKPVPEWQTAAGGKMEFEVATIRLNKPGAFIPPSFALDTGNSYNRDSYNRSDPHGLFSADFPLSVYIQFAYKLWLTQDQVHSMLASLPKWVATDSFVIQAKAPGDPTKDQMRLMVQSLLADRFNLAVHFETQRTSVMALVLAKPGKTGPKLRPHSEGPPCSASVHIAAHNPPGKVPDVFPPYCGGYMAMPGPNHTMLMGSRDTTMKLIAASLPSVGGVARPVVDQTGLGGNYDFTLQWTPEPTAPSPPGADTQSDAQGPSFLEALREQLGLKLKPTEAPLDVLVIDHVERPSPN